MHVDLLFDPFGARWSDVRAGAVAAEEAGFDGVWLYDHLAGSMHDEADVLECWTVLSALAAAVPRIALGPMVLNVANRDPGTLAVMAATLQEVSGGRLLLGIGAGGGRNLPYAHEQYALGREVGGDRVRRAAVESAITTLRSVWSGSVGGVDGFLRPDPPVPVIVGGFGPKMAALAGRLGDGFNGPVELAGVARDAHASSGRDPDRFIVTASSGGTTREYERLSELGVHRALVLVRPPFVDAIERLAASKDGRP